MNKLEKENKELRKFATYLDKTLKDVLRQQNRASIL